MWQITLEIRKIFLHLLVGFSFTTRANQHALHHLEGVRLSQLHLNNRPVTQRLCQCRVQNLLILGARLNRLLQTLADLLQLRCKLHLTLNDALHCVCLYDVGPRLDKYTTCFFEWMCILLNFFQYIVFYPSPRLNLTHMLCGSIAILFEFILEHFSFKLYTLYNCISI